MDTAFQWCRMHLNKLQKIKHPEGYKHRSVRKTGTADTAEWVTNAGIDSRYPIPSAHREELANMHTTSQFLSKKTVAQTMKVFFFVVVLF